MSEQEYAVAKLSDLSDGEMKQVAAGETKILLACVGGQHYALGAHCTHYGAPLAAGVLSGERIVCPWHHGCFNSRTGDLVEPPAIDSLPRFALRIEGEQILVTLPDPVPDRRTPAMAGRDAKDPRTFVILGGGAAGYMAAQTLREDGFTGRVVMVTREDRAPYDRPNLSKDYLQGQAEPEWMPLRGDDFFAEQGIELVREKTVEKVDPAAQTVTFADGESLAYSCLLIATGGTPRGLTFPAAARENVFLLRSFADADAIIAAAGKGKRVAVIGASFIGMEAAASLKVRGCDVTAVAPGAVPFQKILGAEIGKLFQSIHEHHGVKFKLGSKVKEFAGEEAVTAVVLENGESIEVDLVVVGVGVKPATEFLTGVELHADGGVIADQYLCIAENVYAAGDIVHFPDARTGESTRIEHWRTALQQGRVAAHNMAGKPAAFTEVPFFWTTQFGATLNYVGHVQDWDRIIIEGDLEQQGFIAIYVKDERIRAVAGMNRDHELAKWEERFRLGEVPAPGEM